MVVVRKMAFVNVRTAIMETTVRLVLLHYVVMAVVLLILVNLSYLIVK